MNRDPTPTLFDLLPTVSGIAVTDFFGQAAIAAIQAALTRKANKTYVLCRVRRKDVLAKPEELVRQLWLHRLEVHYGYPATRLAVEHPITFGRDTSKRADIVVFEDGRPTVPYPVFLNWGPTSRLSA